MFAAFSWLVLGLCSLCYAQREVIRLHDNWEFRQVGKEQWRAAEVPGSVHQDLLRHNLLPDPFYGTNEKLIQWVENEDWEYRTTFRVTPEQLAKDGALLQFKGLDTYADVYLNDKLILQGNNMYLAYDCPVKHLLKPGENQMRIYFHSPITRVLPQWEATGYEYPADNDQSKRRLSVYSRKAPYHFGWDWGIRMVTSGVWRPIELRFYDQARITDFHVRQDNITPERAEVNCSVSLYALQGGEASVSVEARLNGQLQQEVRRVTLKQGENTISIPMTFDKPALWMPAGMGEQPLYDFTAQVVRQNVVVDECKQHIGLRKVEVVCEKDKWGESFFYRVNGHPVYAKGANYIPSDILLPRVTKEKYQQLFADTRNSNMNMLRIWGGGVYEDDYFYHLADSLGIMIWQDFMFACTPYPQDKDFLHNVEKEVDYNIRRLRNHASIVMWCGNNEVLEALNYWGFQERYDPKVYELFYVGYDKLFRDLLPRKVKELDGNRYYVHTSPYQGHWKMPEQFHIRDSHEWGIWQGGLPFEAFAERLPRFSSEFGFQSMPEMKTIRAFAAPEDYDLESEVMRAHQKSWVGNRVIGEYIERYYHTPRSFEELTYLSQVVQGMGMRIGFEAQRRNRPYCMGTLFWQINDIWPVLSWSSIDSYGNWKALHYQAKRAFASPALSVETKGNELLFHVMSDELKTQEAVCRTTLMDFRGKVLRKATDRLTVPANASAVFASKNKAEWGTDSTATFLRITLETSKGKPLCDYVHYFCKPKHLALPAAKVKKQVKMQDGKCIVTLQSDVLVKDLFVECPWQGARYSDNYFDLLPGQKKRVEITSKDITSTQPVSDIQILSVN